MWFLESDVGLITESVLWSINYSKNCNCCNYGWLGWIFPI